MDYAYAQRVLSNNLLRRSLTVSYTDKFGRLSSLQYWEAPRDEKGRMPQSVLQVSPPAIKSPVVGVGIGMTPEGSETILLLVEKKTRGFDSKKLVASLGLGDLQIEEMASGRAIPSARPALGGESLGHSNGDTGTFGCLVRDSTSALFLLSCNHVIAALNQGQRGADIVWQPGKNNGGSAKSRIGTLYDFAYITPGGSTGNRIDAALCKPDKPSDVSSSIKSIGSLSGSQSVSLNDPVRKSGAKSGLTAGKVRVKNLSVIVDYPGGVQALFDDQVGIVSTKGGKNFSEQGDSGSIVVDSQDRAVGLLMSCLSGTDLTIANPIQQVLQHFQVTIA
jgi:hypothetical protein